MSRELSRRGFLATVGASLAWPLAASGTVRAAPFRIRTITAGVSLKNGTDLVTAQAALDFLTPARQRFLDAGYEVQTIRIATQPLARYLPAWTSPAGVDALRGFDRFAADANLAFSVGPVLTDDEPAPGFAAWAADVVQAAPGLSFSAFVASPEHGIHPQAVRAAAEAVAAIARATPGGDGNFNFAATAFCPPGTPFFPAGWHEGDHAFAIGLESPPLLQAAFEGVRDFTGARRALLAVMNDALAPVALLAERIATETGWRYLGIDTSPAPGLDASIGQAIETLTGKPFGSASTLAACAAITDVLKSVDVRTCGYSGLMLPVLEDPVLAKRADAGAYGVSELLLYSSVCGTGLDVVPLPGDTPVADLAATIGDVAALATRYRKALSARLLPAPGKRAGERVHFDNPHLTDALVMPPG